jgi:hypothetical protein
VKISRVGDAVMASQSQSKQDPPAGIPDDVQPIEIPRAVHVRYGKDEWVWVEGDADSLGIDRLPLDYWHRTFTQQEAIAYGKRYLAGLRRSAARA